MIWMNLTPRSTMRRASRQLVPNGRVVSLLIPYISRVAGVSLEKSRSSGPADLHAKRQLIRGDARRNLDVARSRKVLLVEIANRVESHPLVLGIDPGEDSRDGAPDRPNCGKALLGTLKAGSRCSSFRSRRRGIPRRKSARRNREDSWIRFRDHKSPMLPWRGVPAGSCPKSSSVGRDDG